MNIYHGKRCACRGAFYCVALFLGGLGTAAPRLVSTSPEITELLFQLGKGADLIATPQFSDFPPEAKKLRVLGPLFDPNLELTARLAPDWVVLDRANVNAVYQRGLQSLRQPALELDLGRVEKVFSESRRLLRAIYQQSGSPLLTRYERCWKALSTAPATRRFLAFAWLTPPILVGHPTYLSDLLSTVAGANGLPAYLKLPYPRVSEDWLAGRAPDVAFVLDSAGQSNEARDLFRKWWPGWRGAMITLNGDAFSRATLTPLRHLGELKGDLPKECRDLP